ncbi:hypothetical protein [Paraflavitalea sp. CAU 1676]|uniref:hypothetical protein n=1 Tax=Paraflavitalea sp. CAU 1676 TaxID=3032598 RepID=UPI0023DC1E82|nr:hypothetical protein [Paraflavitalea sp. CAU 1676]MDF2189286.1 hypothetical protein [Paraflavitalea sp. CAU 1676]
MSTNLCVTVGDNVPVIDCEGKRARPRMFLAGSKEFTPAEYLVNGKWDEATFTAAILAAINLNTGVAGKLFPFPEILQVDDNSEAPTTGSLAFGPIRYLGNGKYGYTYSVEVGHSTYQALLTYHGKKVPLYTYDDASQFWANKNKTTGNLKGEMATIGILGGGFENGTDATSGVVQITIAFNDVEAFKKRSAYAEFNNLAISDLVPLKNTSLYDVQAHAANVYKIGLKIPTAKIGQDLNPWAEIGAAIAAMTFTAGTGTGYGTALTITSVAADNTLGCFTVTFDSTAFTALGSGAKIRLVPPTVATLYAAGITGFELLPVVVIK